jgi:hypothetical protein
MGRLLLSLSHHLSDRLGEWYASQEIWLLKAAIS